MVNSTHIIPAFLELIAVFLACFCFLSFYLLFWQRKRGKRAQAGEMAGRGRGKRRHPTEQGARLWGGIHDLSRKAAVQLTEPPRSPKELIILLSNSDWWINNQKQIQILRAQKKLTGWYKIWGVPKTGRWYQEVDEQRWLSTSNYRSFWDAVEFRVQKE